MEGGRRLLRCHNSEMQARRKDNKTASLQEAHSNGGKTGSRYRVIRLKLTVNKATAGRLHKQAAPTSELLKNNSVFSNAPCHVRSCWSDP